MSSTDPQGQHPENGGRSTQPRGFAALAMDWFGIALEAADGFYKGVTGRPGGPRTSGQQRASRSDGGDIPETGSTPQPTDAPLADVEREYGHVHGEPVEEVIQHGFPSSEHAEPSQGSEAASQSAAETETPQADETSSAEQPSAGE